MKNLKLNTSMIKFSIHTELHVDIATQYVICKTCYTFIPVYLSVNKYSAYNNEQFVVCLVRITKICSIVQVFYQNC